MKFQECKYIPKRDVVESTLKALANRKRKDFDSTAMGYFTAIARWQDARRPFLNIYPSVVECLLNTNSRIDPALIPEGIVHSLGAIEVRTPSNSSVPPFFISIGESQNLLDGTTKNAITATLDNGEYLLGRFFHFGEVTDETQVTEDSVSMTPTDVSLLRSLAGLTIGILLLAADPEYCTPILLNRDKRRNLKTPNDIDKAVERAHRRGVVGFDLGKDIETSPHFRRPHFAIRWTGKGGKVPMLRPVKGSIINRRLLGEIPTGYADEEDPPGD